MDPDSRIPGMFESKKLIFSNFDVGSVFIRYSVITPISKSRHALIDITSNTQCPVISLEFRDVSWIKKWASSQALSLNLFRHKTSPLSHFSQNAPMPLSIYLLNIHLSATISRCFLHFGWTKWTKMNETGRMDLKSLFSIWKCFSYYSI